MKVSDYHLGFIGFGHMASILFQAIDHAKLLPRSQILFTQRDPEKSKRNEIKYKVTSTSLKNLVEKSDILILGVRPNQVELVLKEIKKLEPDSTKMLVTVVAGIKLEFYDPFWKGQIVRAMPNVASSVAEGMTTFSFKEGATNEFKDLSRILFSSTGQVLTIPEKLMDIATAIAGSGPGFVFRMIEAFSKTGNKYGLSEKEALLLASQAFLGAAKMIVKGEHPEHLLTQIATPNGTTEAGLKKLTALGISDQLEKVLEASMKRSIELSQEYQ